MNTKTDSINLNGIDYPYVIKKNKKSRNLKFRYYNGEIHISSPYHYSKKYIYERMIELKDNIQNLINVSKKREVSFNNFDDINFFGKDYIIVYSNKTYLGENKIYLDKNDPKEAYYFLAKKEGMKIIKERVNYYLNIIEPKLELKELKMRTMVSRYGDCYPTRKIITLNTKLAYFNIEQIDSVIVHELVHLIYPNHSKEFYNKVLQYCPNYYKLHQEINEVSLR